MSEFQQVVSEGKENIKRKARKLLYFLLLFSGIALAVYFLVCNFTYSEGTRIGYVMKISYKGILFKTYEGTLNLSTREDLGIKTWDFSAKSKDTYEALGDSEGKRVKLYYKQKIKVMPWQGKTPYLVYQVEQIEE